MTLTHRSRALMALLTRQGEDLRNGDLAGLARSTPALARALEQLGRTRPAETDEEALQSLRRAARQNAELMAAALRGVKAARAMLAQKPDASFTGYDATGRTAPIGSARPNLERRS
ncbi:hypothetical protein [Rhodophyticola sp.]|jgi:flagellar biosynthesis/type III secretory pathway chaperone|uniref:hypothetical protein n=1 Tax=Rhodophyticola sp. TaxID=2680032 RepID=UPI001AFFBE02|nr:hypothetical protein [Roseicyclus sp.]MBO6625066.1 hypothetical protein [Roseicyclus sp.]MBO6923543.1 hypothetical protein [Roseicyclus sp.]